MSYLIDYIEGTKTTTIPFWFMRQAGRYLPEYRELRQKAGSFLDLCFNPEQAAEVTLQPLKRFDTDIAILFSDILIIPLALGQNLSFIKGEGPVLSPKIDETKLDFLKESSEKWAPILQTVSKVRQSLSPHQTLIGFAGAPWTVATYMVEGGSSKNFADTKAWAFRDPDSFQKLINLLIDATVLYLDQQIQAGAQVVKLFDSWAGALPYDLMERWSIDPMNEIARRLKEIHPKVPIIFFPKGIGYGYEAFCDKLLCSVLAVDAQLPLSVVRRLQEKVVVQGNLDPLIMLSSKKAIEEKTKNLISSVDRSRLIFNFGHGVVPQMPPENLGFLCSLLKSL